MTALAEYAGLERVALRARPCPELGAVEIVVGHEVLVLAPRHAVDFAEQVLRCVTDLSQGAGR